MRTRPASSASAKYNAEGRGYESLLESIRRYGKAYSRLAEMFDARYPRYACRRTRLQ